MALQVLLPLDGSPFSEQVLSFVGGLTRTADVVLHLVQVHRTIRPFNARGPVSVFVDWDQRAGEQEYLDRVGGWLRTEFGCTVRTTVLQGGVVSALNGYMREENIGLVVITTYGSGGLKRAWMGSVAAGLVRTSPAPVLLVHPGVNGSPIATKAVESILIPLDGSALSEQIIAPACTLASMLGARIRLLQVVTPARLAPPPGLEETNGTASDLARERASEYLDELAHELRACGHMVDSNVIVHWNPAAAILDFCDGNADLIAMATHGRGGWQRVSLGSVTERVQRNTLLPMLLLQPIARVDSYVPTVSALLPRSAAV